MRINTNDFINIIDSKLDKSIADNDLAKDAVKAFIASISESLLTHKRISIRGLGTFKINHWQNKAKDGIERDCTTITFKTSKEMVRAHGEPVTHSAG